ncbi:SMI1/KNR4 family protein [Lacinutrix salivirga]
MRFLSKIYKNLRDNKTELLGCSSDEIKKIEQEIEFSLPKSYLEFLEIMGKGMLKDIETPNYYDYGTFKGTYIFYDSILKHKEWLINQLNEYNRQDLAEKITETEFIFYDHQGYLFAFFKLDEGDNPPVYGYEEGYEGDSFPKIADSLSSFYERHLEGDKTLFSELRV